MGNLLISGNGKRGIRWIMSVALVVAGGMMLMRAEAMSQQAFWVGRTASSRMIENIMGYGGFGLIIFSILFLAVDAWLAKKTHGFIRVYENCVEGVSTGENFKLTYDQINKVDATCKSVTIHVSNAMYRCFVPNGLEIQNVILNQRNLHGNTQKEGEIRTG